ncbi:MAG: hypothetical protein JNJ73_06565 [Hyphomonadaceae bacterium]|nr:hypothetical protein [Hyphomonadaceae bacterium]
MFQSASRRASHRFYSDVYDNARHGQFLDWQEAELKSKYLAAFRIDTLLHEKIVIPDSDLFYSGLFLTTRPEDLPLDRVIIRARARDLGESFRLTAVDPNSQYARQCDFAGLPHDQRRALHEGLATFPAREIPDWRSIKRAFRQCGVDEVHADLMDSGWAYWVEACQKRPGLIELWSPDFAFQERCDIELNLTKANLISSFRTEAGSETLREVWEARQSRNRVNGILAKKRSETSDAAELADIATVESWFHEAYSISRGTHHLCDTKEVSDIYGAHAFTPERDHIDKLSVAADPNLSSEHRRAFAEIPTGVIAAMGQIRPTQFSRLCKRADSELRKWYSSDDFSSLQRAVEKIIVAMDKEKAHVPDPSPVMEGIEAYRKPIFDAVSVMTSILVREPLGTLVTFSVEAANFVVGRVTGLTGKAQRVGSRVVATARRRILRR